MFTLPLSPAFHISCITSSLLNFFIIHFFSNSSSFFRPQTLPRFNLFQLCSPFLSLSSLAHFFNLSHSFSPLRALFLLTFFFLFYILCGPLAFFPSHSISLPHFLSLASIFHSSVLFTLSRAIFPYPCPLFFNISHPLSPSCLLSFAPSLPVSSCCQ